MFLRRIKKTALSGALDFFNRNPVLLVEMTVLKKYSRISANTLYYAPLPAEVKMGLHIILGA